MNHSFRQTDTLDAVLRRAPGAADVLHRLALDTCCGADRSLREAAEVAGLPVEDLLAQLNAAPVAASCNL
jgi:regulator of cell morphogenesis and NO signaling